MKSQPSSASLDETFAERLNSQKLGMRESVGQYELIGKLRRGGMGTVYRAMHTRLKRLVAIKLLRPDRIDHHGAVARFLREMEAVGRLDHPNLVRAYDAGEADGRHFLAMELVVGDDLRRLVGRLGPLSVPDACEVVRQAARGLQHAHENGLVHRDVKPSNLMVTVDGTIKLLDLGLARLADGESGHSGHTTTDRVLGSGDYLAPEQAEDPRQADARSDLYALGCTLYFLLAGHAPFEDTRHNTFGRKLLAHATERVPNLARHRPDLPKGLVNLLERMLAKRPANRPTNMAEVEQALVAWATGSNLPALLAGLPKEGPHVLGHSAGIDPADFWTAERAGHDGRQPPPGKVRPAIARSWRRFGPAFLAAGLGVVILALAVAVPRTRIETRQPRQLNPAAMVQQPASLPGTHGWTLETRGGRAAITHLALSPDERLLAAGDAAGCVRVWRSATGDLLRLFVEPGPIRAIAWLSCSRQLAVAAGSLRLWNTDSGHLLWEAPLCETDPATSLDYHPTGMLASGHQSGEICLWDVSARQVSTTLSGHGGSVTALRFSTDGSRLASGDEGRSIRVWDMPDGRPLKHFHDAEPGPIRRLAWSPNGTCLASCGGEKHLTAWEQAEDFRPRRENPANQPVGDLGWSDDGERFFSVSGGSAGMEFAVLWDGEVRRQIRRPLMAPNAATAMTWSRDGTTVYCGLRNGEIVTYLPDSDELKGFRQAAATRTIIIAWSPDGSRLLLGDSSGCARLWNVNEAGQVLAVSASKHPVSALAWDPGGGRFAAGHTDGVLVIADASTGSFLQQMSCEGHVLDAAFSPDGQWLATAVEHSACRVWSAATGSESMRFSLDSPSVVNAVAWSSDSRYLAFSAWDERVRLADVERRQVICDWNSDQGCVEQMLWEPRTHVLCTSGSRGGIAYWNAVTGTLLRREDGCLHKERQQGNPLGTLHASCTSGGLRGVSPDGQVSVQPLGGSELGVQHTATGTLRLVLCPMPGGRWLAVNPSTGHFQANLDALETPVYVVATDRGQVNLTPAGFAARYGWINMPGKAALDIPICPGKSGPP
jgi:WD40 repeat protein/tRNA A-37 threonylcarbamoyl transferase component Bud32